MPKNLIIEYPIITIMWVAGLSILGGVAGYIKKINNGTIKRFSFSELIGELVISGFVGIVTFLLLDSTGIDMRIIAGLVGISAHMGSKSIYLLEQLINKKFNKVFDGLDIK